MTKLISEYLPIFISLYVFIYAAVMLDSQRRPDELEEDTKENRKWYSSITLIVAFVVVAYVSYQKFYCEGDNCKLYSINL